MKQTCGKNLEDRHLLIDTFALSSIAKNLSFSGTEFSKAFSIPRPAERNGSSISTV